MDETKYLIARYADSVWEDYKDMEDYFSLKVSLVSGMSSKGKIKNIYTETYAESNDLRTWFPTDIARENTTITITLGFNGANRHDLFDSFISWASGYLLKFKDVVRNRETEMFLLEAVELDDDFLFGSDPYLTAEIKFTNIHGQTVKPT